MSSRIIIELWASPASQPDAWARLEGALDEIGATHLRAPEEGPPFIATAIVPGDLPGAIDRVCQLDGVRRAEEDAWSGTF